MCANITFSTLFEVYEERKRISLNFLSIYLHDPKNHLLTKIGTGKS